MDWQTIGSIILKYGIEVILGVVVTGIGFMVKKYIRLSEEERKKGQKEYYSKLQEDISKENKEMVQEVLKSSQDGDAKLQAQIDSLSNSLNTLTSGMLSVQGKEFKAQCRALLDPNHTITLDEWEEIFEDHEAYNALGGNHKGDQLFLLVKEKAENTLTGIK